MGQLHLFPCLPKKFTPPSTVLSIAINFHTINSPQIFNQIISSQSLIYIYIYVFPSIVFIDFNLIDDLLVLIEFIIPCIVLPLLIQKIMLMWADLGFSRRKSCIYFRNEIYSWVPWKEGTLLSSSRWQWSCNYVHHFGTGIYVYVCVFPFL